MHMEQQVDEDFIDAFCQALVSFAAFNGCEQVITGSSQMDKLSAQIQSRLPAITRQSLSQAILL